MLKIKKSILLILSIGLCLIAPIQGEVLTLEETEKLIKRNTKKLYLNHITDIELKAAESLSEFKGDISLAGIKSLTVEKADALSKHQGTIILSSLQKLNSKPLTLKLARQRRSLNLNGLKEVSDEFLEILVTTKGHTVQPGDSVRSNIKRSDKNLSVLLLNGITELSDRSAKHFSNHVGLLALNGIQHVTELQAKELSKHRGTLIMNGLVELNLDFTSSISKHQGDLCFRGLTTITLDMAHELKTHQGALILLGLKDINEEVLKVLQEHPKPIIPSVFMKKSSVF